MCLVDKSFKILILVIIGPWKQKIQEIINNSNKYRTIFTFFKYKIRGSAFSEIPGVPQTTLITHTGIQPIMCIRSVQKKSNKTISHGK
jgi:hypothetical protein